jgi:hypothetical protein
MHNKTGGFRQVVLRDNKLVFTRMAQYSPNEKPSVMAGNVEQEIKNTIEYLKRLSFSQGSELHIITIIGEEIKNNINSNIFNATSCVLLTPYEAATLLKIEDAILSADKFTDIFLSCAFLQYKKHCLKLMSETIKQMEKLYQAIFLSKIAACFAVIALLGYSGYNGYSGFVAQSSLEEKKNEIKQSLVRLENFKQQSKDFKITPAKIDSLIKINDLISYPSPNYDELIVGIANNINKDVQVKNFEWSNNGGNFSADLNNNAAIKSTPDNIIVGVETKLQWEINIGSQDKKQAKIIWNNLQDNLKKSLQKYSIIDEGIEGIGKEQDKLTFDFAQKNQNNNSTENSKLVAKMKIIQATDNPAISTIPVNNAK